jgi:hypothetical protein
MITCFLLTKSTTNLLLTDSQNGAILWTTNFLIPYTLLIDIMPVPSKNYENKPKHYWRKLTRLTNETKWLDMRLKPTSKQLLGVSPTPLPGPSRRPDYSHLATYGQNYARQQYQCFECGDLTHFKWSCPFYTCRTCN